MLPNIQGFVVLNTSTNLYSEGGREPVFSQQPKIWQSMKGVKAHLRLKVWEGYAESGKVNIYTTKIHNKVDEVRFLLHSPYNTTDAEAYDFSGKKVLVVLDYLKEVVNNKAKHHKDSGFTCKLYTDLDDFWNGVNGVTL